MIKLKSNSCNKCSLFFSIVKQKAVEDEFGDFALQQMEGTSGVVSSRRDSRRKKVKKKHIKARKKIRNRKRTTVTRIILVD